MKTDDSSMMSNNDNNDNQKKEEIKEIRKIMNTLLKNLTSFKASPPDEMKKYTIDFLKTCDKDITKLLDEEKNSFVHYCIRDDKPEYLKAIVESYRYIIDNPEIFYSWFTGENSQNLTPLDLAVQRPNKEIINFLFDILQKTDESKFRLLERRNNLFHNAAKKNECYPIIFFNEKLQKVYHDVLILDLPNQFGITPLHYASYYGSRRVVDLLLDFGVNINSRDQEGNTCLHYAVHSGCVRTVKKLLVRGADKSIKGTDDRTPYQLAVETNNIEIAKALQKKTLFGKYFCMEEELGAIKGSRNDLLLVIIEIVVVSVKVLYIARICDMIWDIGWNGELLPSLLDITKNERERERKAFGYFVDCLVGKVNMIKYFI